MKKLKKARPFKTLFKSNKEESEILNSFQILIFIKKVPLPEGAARGLGPRPPCPPPCYATASTNYQFLEFHNLL